MNRSVVVFAGDAPLVQASSIPDHDYAIAADSGLRTAARLGVKIDKAIGDFDSASTTEVNNARAAGATINRFPAAKDATDLELALDATFALGADEVTVIGAAGGRFDHAFANIALLSNERYAPMNITAVIDLARIHVVRDKVLLSGNVGDFVSLIAANGPAKGIRTDGLAYALDGETLQPSSTRGISNELVSRNATITLTSGVLLIVQPGSER